MRMPMSLERNVRYAAATCACIGWLCLTLRASAAGSGFGDLQYRSIGPAISGGRTTAVVGSDRDPTLYFAGGADGGVFKSVDGGASWIPLFDRNSSAAVGAIAIAPGNPNDVWVGTGESNPRNDVESGDGIWHSTDGGKTWTHAGLDGAGSISSIAIDPRDSNAIVVGVLGDVFADSQTRGVYVTRDGGRHWKRTLFLGPSSGVSDLVRVPDRPSTLFAGMYQVRRLPWNLLSGGPNGGIFRSDDNGATWRKLQGRGLPPGITGRIGLAATTGGRIYAIVQSKAGDLWRSDDGGSTWMKMPHSPYVGARPFYFSRIFVDPADRDRVICVGLILSMSADGGRTFKPISTNAGWDYHVAWWSHDGKRIAVGSDEGPVFSGDDGTRFWQPYDLPFSQAYHVGFGRTAPSYDVCVGLQDNNSWCAPSIAYNGIGVLNRDWYVVGPGDGMWVLVDPTDPDLVWSTSTNSDTGQVYLWNRHTQQAAEVSPSARINSDAPSLLPYRFNWDTPIAFTLGASPRVLVGGNVVFESADRGQTWSVISPDLTRNDKAHQRAPGGPISLDISGAETSDTILDLETTALAPATIWAGTDDGLIQLTRDGGTHWSNVTPTGAPPWCRVSTVEPGHFSADTAYAVEDCHMLGDDRPYVYRTGDGGVSWQAISSNLPPNFFVRSVREDIADKNLLFAGTQRGVFVSFDRGAHWQSLRLNMPATAVYDLEIVPQTDDLLVASHGRGVWILDDLRALRDLASARASASATLFAPRDAYRMWEWSPVNSFQGGTLPDNQFVGDNPSYGALLTYYLAKPPAQHPTIDVVDADGRVVRHLSGDDVPGAAGINRTSWDLAEDGPTQWHGTYKENRGPEEGAEVVPGTFTVRLNVNGHVIERPLRVLPDPRDQASHEQYVRRHDFLAGIYDELGAVDAMLNQIDARLAHADAARAASLRAFRAQLTFDPRNVEDLGGPQGLRERLLDAVARLGTAFQAPTAAQVAEASDMHALFVRLSAEYAGLK